MSEAPLNHPTAEELRALSLGQLADAELARVSAHLDDCPACCRRIARTAVRRSAGLTSPSRRRASLC